MKSGKEREKETESSRKYTKMTNKIQQLNRIVSQSKFTLADSLPFHKRRAIAEKESIENRNFNCIAYRISKSVSRNACVSVYVNHC